MKKLNAFYFSGTGNTRYVTHMLCARLSGSYETAVFDVAAGDCAAALQQADLILLAFPVYGSSPPLPMRRFVHRCGKSFCGKQVIVAATQYMFSGDGAASLGRTVEKYGGNVTFAEHFRMPNNLSDCKILKLKNGPELAGLLKQTDRRIDAFAEKILKGEPFRRGFNPVSRAVGYFCQRAWWRMAEKEKSESLKIDPARCVGCAACVKSCPVSNLKFEQGKARPLGNCALCYRCVNLCPSRAITLVGKEPPAVQYKGPSRK